MFITSHYITLCRHGIKALDYLFPLILWPPLTILWILVRKLKFRYFYLLCFVAVPIVFSIKDFIKELQFSMTCEQQTPPIQYNPIYLQNNTLWRKIKTDKSYSKFIKIQKTTKNLTGGQ